MKAGGRRKTARRSWSGLTHSVAIPYHFPTGRYANVEASCAERLHELPLQRLVCVSPICKSDRSGEQKFSVKRSLS
ncbi:hypothetical protein [Nostoc sp. FACHB-133]|uniref:hypothetical protein n=1 Tax=Nostoc sp. FACHB-133 TaxID=2692835 RepID=UPI0016821983|nr:hypothetical protein [Nostoc sp. FACHB-133]MBD2521985.1 hypothetical protein [Nostoc sp. FACHB-133]